LVVFAVAGGRGLETPARHCSRLRNITIASPEMTVREVVDLVRRGQLQTAIPVVDNDRLVGIVTVSDLLELAARIRRPSPAAASAG
jgi:CBS domain-containing protein